MKKWIAAFVCLLVSVSVTSAVVFAEEAYTEFTDNGLTISGYGIERGKDYEITVGDSKDDGVKNALTILSDKEMTISGDSGTTQRRIWVASPNGANLTFSDLTIVLFKGDDVKEDNSPYGSFVKGNPSAAFGVADNVEYVNITLKGNNVLHSGPGRAGLENNSVPLVIKGDGKLDAYGCNGGAGIGGAAGKPGENITIESGTVIATGSVITKKYNNNDAVIDGGAGIGGGSGCSGENITINGGTVTAKSTLESIWTFSYGHGGGAGIGGGNGGAGRGITITDGTVKATGISGAGIGGGLHGDGVDITISGGEVYAKTTYTNTGGSSADAHQGGAGIGGGCGGNGEKIIISGGKVIAKNAIEYKGVYFDDDYAFDCDCDCDCGCDDKFDCDCDCDGDGVGDCSKKVIQMSTVHFDDDGIYDGEDRAYLAASVNGMGIDAVGNGAGIGGGAVCDGNGGLGCDITICGSADVKAGGGVNGAGIGGGKDGSSERITIKLNFEGSFDEEGNFVIKDEATPGSAGKIYARAQHGAAIGGGNGGNGISIDISGSGAITAYASVGGAGIGGGNGGDGDTIDISGSVKIIAYSEGGAGIGGGKMVPQSEFVPGVGDVYDYIGGAGKDITITLTDGEEGGVIYATSADGGAGIGGGNGGNADTITITGGTVYARSLEYYNNKDNPGSGAGIGGGKMVSQRKYVQGMGVQYDYTGGNGSDIIISNSNVTAISGTGAGIGGGQYGSGSSIAIEGGNITATATGTTITSFGNSYLSPSGAGIGGGAAYFDYSTGVLGGSGTDITISNGANITATSNSGGAGIGGGASGGSGTNITISGDKTNVSATSNSGGAGIGGGAGGSGMKGGSGTNITIDGGENITATGNQGGAGIGGGRGSSYYSGGSGDQITISGGTNIIATGQAGAGIGGGAYGNASGIEINGGTNITATGQGASGIGGGQNGSCTDITISGGSVTAAGVGSDELSGINAETVKIEGEKTVVTANGYGDGAGITGDKITINSGTVTAVGGSGSDAGIDGANVSMGTDETSYPWVYTDGINGLTESTNSDLAIVFNIDKTEGTIYGGKVELTEDYALGLPCTKLTVKAGAEFITDNKLILNDGVILYLEAGAKLDKYNKMTINSGEIQHEDKSIYVPDTTSRAIKMVCDICGKEEPHNWKTEWKINSTHHWHECVPGTDCSVDNNLLEACSITEDSQKAGYAEHEYDFDAPTYGDDGKLHYFCKDCNDEYVVDIPTIKLIKVDGDDAPLEGAEFGLYSDEACTNLSTSKNPNANSTATTAKDVNNKAVVSFAAELGKTYYIKEIAAPEGYTASSEVYRAEVGADGEVTYSIAGSETTSEDIPVCENVKIIPAPAKIIKVDDEGNPLAGAEFGLYRDEACTAEIRTALTAIDNNDMSDTYQEAVASFDTELDKTYYIKETTAPEGYEVSDEVYRAVVGADGKVTYSVVDSETALTGIPVCENYAIEDIVSDPVKIIKVDGEGGTPLEGAEFGLYSDVACTAEIKTALTAIDNNDMSDTYQEAVVSFDTEFDTIYYIKETKAPNGYTASNEVYRAAVGADGKVTYSVVDPETALTGIPVCENYAIEDIVSDPARIIKVDGETGAPLEGAWFGLYSNAECTDLIKTGTTVIGGDNRAVVSFTTEPNKTYYIKETAAPEGYEASDEVYKAVVDADGKVTYGAADSETTSETVPVCENYAVEDIVSDPAEIIKEDGEGNPLAGARFGLYSNAECTDLITTGTTVLGGADNRATVSFATEPNMTYYIREIAAPEGYEVSDEVYRAVVGADGKVTYGAADSEATSETVPICKNYAIEVISDPARIIKVDGETGAPLEGAWFGLYSNAECTDLIKTGTTVIGGADNRAVVSFTTEPNKTYYIKETAAPEGYEASDEVYKAVVDADGKVTYGAADSETTSETVPVCENYAIEVIISAPAEIIKVDGETGAPLAGAEFGLYSDAECTDLIKIGTTVLGGADNRAAVSFTTEPNKTYYIKETKAPEGYEASNEVYKAVVDANGKVTYGAAGSEATSETVPVCKNYAVKVIISAPAKIVKVDGETEVPLTGARFGLYSDAECTNLLTTGITKIDTDNASNTYNKAVVSFATEPNKMYYIKETKAPDGYEVSGEVYKVVVDADGKVTYGAAGSETTSETVPVCKNEKTADDDDDTSDPESDPESAPESAPPAKAISPKTGDTAEFGNAGIAILSGIICAASLVGGVQKRKRKV